MTNITLQEFGGMVPRYGEQRIPNEASTRASNTLLLSGELRGIKSQARQVDLRSIPFEIKRIYRIPTDAGLSWIPFDDATIDFVKGPLVNDLHDRYYWTSENGKPQMSAASDLVAGNPSYVLGVPAPDHTDHADWTVTPDDSGTAPIVTRAYVYTYVTGFGEESAPSEAVVATGKDDDVWEIRLMLSGEDIADLADRNITKKRIYRTVSAPNGSVDYHVVDEIALAQDDYDDIMSTNDVGANAILETQDWNPPPDDLVGLIVHPNGFLMGFTGRDIYFSQPYRPHAWPAGWVLTTEDIIQGFGVYGTSVAVCTQGYPYILSGIRPDGSTFTKAQTPSPCVSDRRGIVSMPFGVYYPSGDGLMLISASGFQNATPQLITRDEWTAQFNPALLDAVRWQSQYVAFWDSNDGFMFAPDEPKSALVLLNDSALHSVIQTDAFSAAVFVVKDNIVYEWNPPAGLPQTYEWESKEFVTPRPVNFAACKFEFNDLRDLTEEDLADYKEYNTQRFGYPMNHFNFHGFNQVRKMNTIPGFTPPEPILNEDSQPFHASVLYPTGLGSDGFFKGALFFKLWADGNLVLNIPIDDEQVYRLPEGYLAKRWKFGFVGTKDLKSFKIAETGKELAEI